MLFNLVADALSVLLDVGIAKGHISGVLNDVLPGGISHIQYADDTVIMIDGSKKSILNLKLIYALPQHQGQREIHGEQRPELGEGGQITNWLPLKATR